MKKFWYFTAFVLIVIIIGVAGVFSFGRQSDDDLPKFDKTWTFSAADLRKLHIVSDYEVNVTFVKSTDGSNSIHLMGQGTEKMIEKAMKTEISSQSLKLDLTQLPKKYINFFDFSFVNVKEQLTISVTDDFLLESLQLDLDSGEVDITDAAIARITDAQLSVDSGSLKFNNFQSDRLDIDMDSGNVTGNNVTAELTASVDSGNIKIEKLTGRSSISVDSGNIRLYKSDNSASELSVDSGSVYVQVPSSFAGFYDLHVDSGTINAPDSKRETNDYIKVRTDSGNIKIEQQ